MMTRNGTPGMLLAALILAVPASAAEQGARELVAKIKAVGKQGQGNPEAAAAWKQLVARGPAALVDVLEAFNDNEELAANWLRPAVDAIAETALRNRQPLPADQLTKFIKQTSHDPSARRIAYEWLCKVDKTAPDKLLPGMLKDPSAELRRDAVAVVVKEADKLKGEGKKDAARDAYAKALAGACDEDQVDAIAKELKDLGQAVDLAAHFGFVRNWHLITPFDNKGAAGFPVAYPPEKGVDLKAKYKGKNGDEARWVGYVTADPHGSVDLKKLLGHLKGTIAYAYAVIDAPEERPIQIRAGSYNAIKVFLNGKEVLAFEEYHHGMRVDQYACNAMLKKGRNELLLKVCQNEQSESWAQSWIFQVRLCDRTGAAVPFTQEPVKSEVTPKEEPKKEKK